MGIKIVSYRVIVSRSCYHYKIRVTICRCAVKCGCQIKIFPGKVFLDIFITDGRSAAVDKLYLLWNDVHCRDPVMLSEQCRQAQTDIAGARDCDIIFSHGD